ncbi:hypothetical protein RYX36_000442, partial [Vicia faba]
VNDLGEFVSLSHGSTETFSSCVSPLPKFCLLIYYTKTVYLLHINPFSINMVERMQLSYKV